MGGGLEKVKKKSFGGHSKDAVRQGTPQRGGGWSLFSLQRTDEAKVQPLVENSYR